MKTPTHTWDLNNLDPAQRYPIEGFISDTYAYSPYQNRDGVIVCGGRGIVAIAVSHAPNMSIYTKYTTPMLQGVSWAEEMGAAHAEKLRRTTNHDV